MTAPLHPTHKQMPGLVASRGRFAANAYTDAHTRRMERQRDLLRRSAILSEAGPDA